MHLFYIYIYMCVCVCVCVLYWALIPPGQPFVATSKNTSVVNNICISSFRYTHVITSRKFQLN